MKIKVDKQGNEAIHQLCDIALKTSGIQSIQGVTQILHSIEVEPDPKEEDEKKKQTKKG